MPLPVARPVEKVEEVQFAHVVKLAESVAKVVEVVDKRLGTAARAVRAVAPAFVALPDAFLDAGPPDVVPLQPITPPWPDMGGGFADLSGLLGGMDFGAMGTEFYG